MHVLSEGASNLDWLRERWPEIAERVDRHRAGERGMPPLEPKLATAFGKADSSRKPAPVKKARRVSKRRRRLTPKASQPAVQHVLLIRVDGRLVGFLFGSERAAERAAVETKLDTVMVPLAPRRMLGCSYDERTDDEV